MRVLPTMLACGTFYFASSLALAQVSAAAPTGDSTQAPSSRCEGLTKMVLPNATVTSAKAYASGSFPAPPEPGPGPDLSEFYKKLPAFCRVTITARPTADSDIAVEIWWPLGSWNGKLQGVDNGGFAGVINYLELAAAVGKGYVAVGTDTGHAGSGIDASWALGHPEKVEDFGNRGIHEMTRLARLVIAQVYGSAPKHAYFAGCSDGGREALMEAQRYPDDYDGILAGAPANYWTALLSSAVVDTQALTATPGSFIPPAKIPTIAAGVLAACDKLDGVADGILNDPRQCHFDPATIQCKDGEDTEKCLTAPQVTALKAIYAGLRDAAGKAIFPGYLPGSETGGGGWGLWITGPAPAKSLMAAFGNGFFSDMVYSKPDWDYKSFTVESGMQAASDKTATALNAVNPDLSAFRAHGGKLLIYHGWNDPAIPALNTVNYYEQVLAKMGQADAGSFTRLYMVPGMQHCSGGPGADSFGQSGTWAAEDPAHNIRVALETWVEKGTAPSTLIAAKVTGDSQAAPAMTRPLCAYPQVAQYKAGSDPSRAESFVCGNSK